LETSKMNKRWTRTLAAGLFLALGACAADGDTDTAPQPTSDEDRVVVAAEDHFNLAGDAVAALSTFSESGTAHVRLQQTYQGLPVFTGQAIAHVDLGTAAVLDVTDARKSFGDLDVAARVAIEDAITTTAQIAGVRDGNADADLQVFVDDAGVAHLAWHVHLVRDNGLAPVERVALVDAHTGETLLTYDALETGKPGGGDPTGTGQTATGTGNSLYSGTVAFNVEPLVSGGYALRDPSQPGAQTRDMNNRQSGSGTLYVDSDGVFGTGSSSDSASAAVDAHYGAQTTLTYYLNVHGRDGIANDGNGALSRVHYGRRYNNAFWSDSCFCMTYGDGDGVALSPLVSLDVAAHEMTHGVTSRTADLVYSGESGGLNEAMSDIFGTSVEFYANNTNDVGDYLIGEEIYLGSRGYLRSMENPRGDGRSIDHYSQYTSGMDVHYSSGLANHAFYLLSEGGTNRTSGITVTGITRAKAERIFYRALTVYMTSGTTFAQARTATIQAAKDLYGATSAEANAVAAVWTACGVN
jgi:Zn-dependent metalloprotease